MKNEFDILEKHIREKGLRYTPQREEILKIFLSVERHLSVDELHKIVKKKNPNIGYVTVYRTMKLFSEAGLCNVVDFGDGIIRYEHQYGHEHHDHLVCVKCGNYTEAVKPKIEALQERLAKENRFIPLRHKLQIFGICSKCSVHK
ncbi:MAG: transcriptional repressor [Candidatus Omnitrophica bacterium]|nr:transcriptional repressor [Candidatus Omnitrophota bacterium]MBU0881786.1 transcriptional repressor [Candidatus Omnitrophota bacterium]MBU1808793.1 transcriptional repressor [Candidatus Omnitrophota bacterium]